MASILSDSENIFLNIINKYDIILDDDYTNIKQIYNNTEHGVDNIKYQAYFNLFNNYYNLKNDINIIYYIIILFYINKNLLINFIRFFTSKLSNYKLFNDFNKITIINYSDLIKLNKEELINYLKTIIDKNYDIFLFFILTFQLYF